MNASTILKFGADGQPVLPDVGEQMGDEYTLHGLARQIEDNLSRHNVTGGRVRVRARVGIGWHGGLVVSTEEHPGTVEVEFEMRDVGFDKYMPHINSRSAG